MKAVFVDRDGVINRNRDDYVKRWEDFVFLPHAAEALAEITRHGLMTVVLTNQSAINRGIITREAVEEIHARMTAELRLVGARIDGVFYCPHRPDERCGCRKPRPGLLLQAAQRLHIDLSQSYLVGDALSDIEAAREVGCIPILVATGRGLRQFVGVGARRLEGYGVSRDLGHAVSRILVAEGLEQGSWLERLKVRQLQPRRA